MDEYFIAGPASDPDFAEAELLADKLTARHEGIKVIKDMRHPCEWGAIRQMITQQRGFNSPGVSTIIWRRDGRLVGGTREFAAFIKNAYLIELGADKAMIESVTRENLEFVEEAAKENAWTPMMGEYKKIWDDNTVFEGSWKDYRPHRGTVTFGSDGSTYEGALRDGKFQGQGVRKYANGAKFVGMYQKGLRQGRGRYDDGSGNIYEGEYSNDKPHGIGTRTWPSGRTYKGQWVESMATGKGVEMRKPKKWTKEDEFDVYEGEFVDGIWSGQGKIEYDNGNVYEGTWAKGHPHGDGKFTWSLDGELSFIGSFVDGIPDYGRIECGDAALSCGYPGEIGRITGEDWVKKLGEAIKEWLSLARLRQPREIPPFDAYPFIASAQQTVTSEILTPEMWDLLRERVTEGGMTLHQCIAPGLSKKKPQTLDVGQESLATLGLVAADSDCYIVFRELFDQVIAKLHNGYNPLRMKHVTDTDSKKLLPIPEVSDILTSCRFSVKRSLIAYPPGTTKVLLPTGTTCILMDERNKVEKAITESLAALKTPAGHLDKGVYYPLAGSDSYAKMKGGMSTEHADQLRSENALFEQQHMFDVRDFPKGRGVWRASAELNKLTVHINKEEHVDVILTMTGTAIDTAFATIFNALTHMEAKGLAKNDHLGFINGNPMNLGSAMTFSVNLKVPKLAKRPDFAALIRVAGLKPTGVVHGDTYTLVAEAPLGHSEVDVVNRVISGLDTIAKQERMLARGRKAIWLWDDKPRVVVLGPPSCDKRAVSARVVEEFGVVRVSAGDLLVEKIKAQTDLGQEAKKFMDAGLFVPSELVTALVLERLAEPDCVERGWLVEGFPRTADQGAAMATAGVTPNKCIVLTLPLDLAVARCTGRKRDPLTGAIYHPQFNPAPEDEEVQARLVQRQDDTRKAIALRIGQFVANLEAVKAALGSNTCKTFAETDKPEESTQEIVKHVLAFVFEPPDVV